MVKLRRNGRNGEVMADPENGVESAKLEIAEMAAQASDQAASAIASAAGDLRKEVERLFEQARGRTLCAVEPAIVGDETEGLAETGAAYGGEEHSLAEISATGQHPSDTPTTPD